MKAISDYQVDSLQMIAELRKESEENAREIRRVVEEGKKRYQVSLARWTLALRKRALKHCHLFE